MEVSVFINYVFEYTQFITIKQVQLPISQHITPYNHNVQIKKNTQLYQLRLVVKNKNPRREARILYV